MNTPPRFHARHPIGIVLAVIVLSLLAASAQALTDGNAELKEAVADRLTQSREALARGVRPVLAQAAKPAPWVPPSAKRLDGFRPVLPPAEPPPAGFAWAAGASAPRR